MQPNMRNIEWVAAGTAASEIRGVLRLLDQTLLPAKIEYLDCTTVTQVWQAIRRLAVRGAPAIGVAAAYGCVLGVQGRTTTTETETANQLRQATDELASSRPTAVNLFWALERMKRATPCTPARLLAEAKAIHAEDAAMCASIGAHTLPLLDRWVFAAARMDKAATAPGIITHCNAGALATGGIGTATAGMYLAHEQGRRFAVFADETRPLLQGARLTALELAAAGMDVTVICDNMAGQVMREGRARMVITGADRIAANGDAANKIGTYGLAVLAHHHRIPFVVAAPSSTFDLSISDGERIPIEYRDESEVTAVFGKRTAPMEAKAYNPAFDVTPASLITAIVTEKGVIEPVNAASVNDMIG